jgi:hypothetical protein
MLGRPAAVWGIPGAADRNNSTFMTPCNKAGGHRQNFADHCGTWGQETDFKRKRAGKFPALLDDS